MQILFLLVGLLIGVVIGFLFAKNKSGQSQVVPFEKLTESETARATAEANLRNLEEKLESQKKEFEELRQKFSSEFENLANKIFEEKSQKFTEQNKSNIDIILNPLKEKIKDFEDKVDKTYKAEAAERNSLRGEIKNLVEASSKISVDAGNLARALKGDSKMQGNWGELILEKVLERSGLKEGMEFQKQFSAESIDGKRIQPDIVVFLPENKHLVIDSKVSMRAYESLVNSESEEEKKALLGQHMDSLRTHIRGLSEKNYQSAKGINAPDFVLMFIPIESSFSAAMQEDQELFAFAWDRKIVIVSPTTLLATLRTIASLWKQERQSKNVMEIAEESGKLYDKFVGFMEDLLEIGRKMEGTQTSYKEAMKKLFDGTGNLITRVEKIKKLGAKTTKSLPQTLIERADPE